MEIEKLDEGLSTLMKEAWKVRQQNFSNSIEFDIPKNTMVISLTGQQCSLNCAHCGGHYLKGMATIEDGKNQCLLNKYTSCLISGGCNKQGVVEFNNNMKFIQYLRDKSKKINMHIGLVDEEQIKMISDLVDCVSFDFVADEETIKEVYGLSKDTKHYIETYKSLRKYTKVIPHICIGLKGGQVKGEYETLKILKDIGVDGLVFIIFIPTPDTTYQDRKPPKLEEILKLLAKARIDFPDVPIHLGCMRPKGKIRANIDYYAVQCGVNKIVNPTKYGIKSAEELGLEIKYGEECCVL